MSSFVPHQGPHTQAHHRPHSYQALLHQAASTGDLANVQHFLKELQGVGNVADVVVRQKVFWFFIVVGGCQLQ
jgi:hypothetical protein